MFSVRRMRAEPIAVLLTARSRADTSPAVERWLGALPELPVGGLDLGAARQLLGPSAPLSRATWEATAGNPLALLELPVAGASPLPVEPVRLSTRLVRAYERRLSGLPDATRRALLLVAVAGSADDAVAEALAEQGLDVGDLEPAEAADLLGRDDRDDRHARHRSALPPPADPQRGLPRRRARPEARGAPGARGRARPPRGPRSRRAPGLPPRRGDPGHGRGRGRAAHRRRPQRGRPQQPRHRARAPRARGAAEPVRARRASGRLLEAALTAQTAGNVAAATPLLDLALVETDDPALITTACHLQCRVQMWSGQPTEARDELLHLADRTRAADPRRSAAMRSQAALLSLTIGDQHLGLAAAAQAAADVHGLPAAERMPVTLIHALALALANDTAGARALLTACEPVLAAADPLTIDQLPVVAANTYASIEEPEAARRWLEAGVRSTRAAGAVGLLPFLLTWLAAACWRDGDWTAALTHAHAAVELAQETGWATEEPQALAILATVEAGLGMEAACREHAARALRLGADTGMRIVEARAEHALGLLELGAGRPDVAAGHLSVTAEFALAHGLGSPVLLEWAGDLLEAHVRAGTPERARRALAVLEREAAAAGPPAGRRRRPALLRAAAGRRRGRRTGLRARRCAGTARQPRDRSRRHAPGCAWASTCGGADSSARPARPWPRRGGASPPRRDGLGGAGRGRAAGCGYAPAGRRRTELRRPRDLPVRPAVGPPAARRGYAAVPRPCSSPRRNCRWHSSSPAGRPTPRPPPSCSCRRRRSSTTCRTPIASSGSAPGPSSCEPCCRRPPYPMPGR